MENIGHGYRNNSIQVNLALSDDPIGRALEVSHQKAAYSFKTQTNDSTIPSNYTLHNQGKTLQFVGVNHVDNLKRMIKNKPENIELEVKCFNTLKNIKDTISKASPATTSIIIEGMSSLDPDQVGADKFLNKLLEKYNEKDWENPMDWGNPDIEQFLLFDNPSEIEFAALMAQHYRIRVISSESEAKQITALCKGKSESYVTHAFMFFACRDLIRFRDSGNGDDQAINAELGVTNQVKHLNKFPEFQSLTMDSIQKIATEIWGEQALQTQIMADEISHLIQPYPIQYIRKFDDISHKKKSQLKLFNQISQDLNKIRDRAIIDLAMQEFKSYKTVIPIFGGGHAKSCYEGFAYVMGSKGQRPLF